MVVVEVLSENTSEPFIILAVVINVPYMWYFEFSHGILKHAMLARRRMRC